VKKLNHKILQQRKQKLEKRIGRKHWKNQETPIMKKANINYEMSGRSEAIGMGGIGAIHTMVSKLELAKDINKEVKLLKTHIPYHESDHVLNIAYNVITGGTCLEDIERLRNDVNYMDAINAELIPDPTTEGDFLRRFDQEAIVSLQACINKSRKKVWQQQEASFHEVATVDMDGTIAQTYGECKEGMDMSYKGIWGYAPLIISLAETSEVLYLVNREGNKKSSDGATEWVDRAIADLQGAFKKIWLRGDTDFSMTRNLDRWDVEGVKFVLGFKCYNKVVRMAEKLPESAWKPLSREPRYEVKTKERKRPENVKERIVKEREYENIKLRSEDVAEFDYRPIYCQKSYRMVVVRKNLTIEKGERRLFDEIRYFFYITNDVEMTAAEVVFFANKRCNQENLIGTLKSGINAMRMPANDLLSNWAYMVIATLAWNLKAWYALMTPNKILSNRILRMEFKCFLNYFILLPCQVVKTGRRLVYKILSYNCYLESFLATFETLKHYKFT
jgi:hypothetical protein